LPLTTYGIYNDSKLNAYINDLGKRIAKVTHRPNLPYTFKVVDTPVVNAFAVPGGYVYFTRGILSYLNNEAELAGIMGHELGHVNARHTAQQYSRMQLAQLGLGLGMAFSEKFREYAGLVQFGVGMLFLRFSRANERQADDLGVEYSIKLGYDANQMAAFFETLERLNPGAGRSGLQGWFSTHPNPVDRIGAIRRKTAEWKQKLGNQTFAVNRNRYLKHIDGIVFGDDPRQGYVQGNAFYHPSFKFVFPVPAKWQVNNTPSQVQVLSQKQDAAIIFTLAQASSPLQAAQKFINDTRAAVSASDAITVNGFPAHRVISTIVTESDTLGVMSYFIRKDNHVFVFHGFTSASEFPLYQSTFLATMRNFKNLTDPRKINVKPDHLQVKAVRTPGTLANVLKQLGVPDKELEQHAIMNGMKLNDRVAKNTLLKIVKH